MALTKAGGQWVLSTATPVSVLASDPAHLFGSDDGVTWVELRAPQPTSGTNKIHSLCGSSPDDLLAIGSEGTQEEDAVWLLRSGSWGPISPPPGAHAAACAASAAGVVVIGADSGGSHAWRLADGKLVDFSTGLPSDADLQGIVAVPGGVAAVGLEKRGGASTASVWFSHDAQPWVGTRLADLPGSTVAMSVVAKGDEVAVIVTANDGVRGWTVRKPW